MWEKIRQPLAFKLFISYLIVILAGILVQVIVVESVIPGAFQRHMAEMQGMMGRMGGSGRMELFNSFRSGVNEALALSAIAALLAAFIASIFISRKLVAPVHAMTQASLRISEGHFEQRVTVPDRDSKYADELTQLALAFNRMTEQLQHTEQIRLQLLGDVSHELRTPLTVIKGSLEALVDGVLPATPETFQKIEQEADRLQRLVNDLQELSRVEAGAYKLELHPIQPESLIRMAYQRFERQFQEKNIALTSSVSPNLPSIQGDSERLLQVLTNLLSNAWQYTPSGGSVHVGASYESNEVVISVQDSGIGIPLENIPQLFTRFYRVDPSRSRQAGGGSGIGLTIARHLVEAHGGRIWAESKGAGEGSTFSFTLPVPGKNRSS